MVFSSSEQYFQYHKAVYHDDHVSARQIMITDDPAQCKYIGSTVHIPDMKNWEDKARDIMYTGCLAKFTQNPKHRDFLLSTGDTVLIEANSSDKFWSAGLKLSDDNLFKQNSWKGKNYLGVVLMEVRDKLKAAWTTEWQMCHIMLLVTRVSIAHATVQNLFTGVIMYINAGE